MTTSTEQERAEFQEWALSKWPLMDVRTRSQDGNYADFETRTRFMAWQEAAARRAPVVPQPVTDADVRKMRDMVVSGQAEEDDLLNLFDRLAPPTPVEIATSQTPAVPQGWTDQLEQVLCDLQVGPYPSIALAVKRIEGLLAAAPQPPEAAQLDDTNVVDMAQDVDSKEAAPVQLPEHVYTLRIRGRLHDHTPALPAFDLEDGEHKLYTEQQVRQLLAAHGIQEQST